MLALFFNPFGFDFVTALILTLTGSYLATTGILYLLAGLFFGLSIFYYKKNSKASLTFMTIGMFLNPFGYDIAFAYTMSLFGGSFVKADLVFYAIAAMFFGVFLVSSKTNPVSLIKNWLKEITKKMYGFINR
jgi:hypothetical protein